MTKLRFVFSLSAMLAASAIGFGNPEPKKPSAIRVAPPSPAFSDSERQRELAARRARVVDRMADNSVMVLLSAEPRIYSNDVDFMYRPPATPVASRNWYTCALPSWPMPGGA